MLGFNNRIVWLPVKNQSSETIPGGALMKVVSPGQDEDGNWLVDQPDTDGDATVIVNGEAEIPPSQVGVGHRDTMAVILYDSAENKPLTGDSYGSKAGSWFASKDKAGFTIDSAGNGRANATRQGAAAYAPKRTIVTPNPVTGIHFGLPIGQFVIAGTLLSPATPPTAYQPKIFAVSLPAGATVSGMMDISCFYDPLPESGASDRTRFYARVSYDDGSSEAEYISSPVLGVSVLFNGTEQPPFDWNTPASFATHVRQFYLKRLQFSFFNSAVSARRIYLCRTDTDGIRNWSFGSLTKIGTVHVHLD
jgi:hypothetical protein